MSRRGLTRKLQVFHNTGMPSLFNNPLNARISRSMIVIGVFAVVAIASLGGAGYFYLQYQESQAVLGKADTTEQQVKQLVDEVGKLIVLPEGEQPQVATVSDVNKLKEQVFFSQAKNGDKVLIYAQAQKAILYDPVQKKIIEVGPINLSEATPSASPTLAEVRVALYNGTSISGLTTAIQEELSEGMANVTVVARENASKNTYTKTIVVDLTGSQNTAASQLADILGGEVGALPEGEKAPGNADMLVILGSE